MASNPAKPRGEPALRSLPTSASRALYSGWEAEVGSPSKSAIIAPSITVIMLKGSLIRGVHFVDGGHHPCSISSQHTMCRQLRAYLPTDATTPAISCVSVSDAEPAAVVAGCLSWSRHPGEVEDRPDGRTKTHRIYASENCCQISGVDHGALVLTFAAGQTDQEQSELWAVVDLFFLAWSL